MYRSISIARFDSYIINMSEKTSHISKSPFEDQSKDGKLLNYSRPLTAKRSELESQKIPKKTILRFNSRQKKPIVKDKITPNLSRMRPTKISVDKEKLYIENMALKVKNNELKEILIKFKAKITQLEREIQKKDDIIPSGSSSNTNLVKLLKQNIKDLRTELQNKDQQIQTQKQNMKLSKFMEMELEVKGYMDECTRLKHYLEEVLKEKEGENKLEVLNYKSTDMKTYDLLKIIDENTKEIYMLREKLKNESLSRSPIRTPKIIEDSLKTSRDFDMLKKEFHLNEKKLIKKIESLKSTVSETLKDLSLEKVKLSEANSLVESLYRELKSLRQKKKSKFAPPKFLKATYDLISSQKISLNEFLSRLTSSEKSFIESKTLLVTLKAYDSSITNDDLDCILGYIKHDSSSNISIKRFLDYFNSYDFEIDATASKSSKIATLFEHLCLRMQLHRIPKENLIEALIGAGASSSKIIHSQEIVLLFTNSPFNFSRNQASTMVDFLFGNEKTQSYSSFIDKFYSTIHDWEIFTAADEENFDGYLLEIVGKYKEDIDKFCMGKDTADKGVVGLDQFYSCLQTLKINLPDRVSGYLLVLFYSHNMELRTVPYKQFLQAYSNVEETPVVEDFKTVLVHKYLEQISAKLISMRMSAREMFSCDENEFMLAEDFISGLKAMEIDDISKENLMVLLEALQYDPEERVVCIHMGELEEILETYGVTVGRNIDTSEIMSDCDTLEEITEGHIQKISMLESGFIGFSEDSGRAPRTSRVSFENSFS